jgi:repressor LexA
MALAKLQLEALTKRDQGASAPRLELDIPHTGCMLPYVMSYNPLSIKELEALRHIRNAILHAGRAPSVRELQELLGYRSPRSAADILERLLTAGFVQRRKNGRLQLVRDIPEDTAHARTVDVPLVGTAPCGAPLLAEENIEAMIPVSLQLARPPHRYFLLHASGTSMNEAGIEDRDLALVRQQSTAAPGDRVVALIDDEATIKEFHRSKETVVLKPRSTDKCHKPIFLSSEFQIQGVVVATIPNWEKE